MLLEYNVLQPSPLNEKVLKDKRKKLRDTFDRVMKMYVSICAQNNVVSYFVDRPRSIKLFSITHVNHYPCLAQGRSGKMGWNTTRRRRLRKTTQHIVDFLRSGSTHAASHSRWNPVAIVPNNTRRIAQYGHSATANAQRVRYAAVIIV